MSTPIISNRSAVKTEDMLIGALLRVPAQAIHRRIIMDLMRQAFARAVLFRKQHSGQAQLPLASYLYEPLYFKP
jgi:hypothetical protein